MKANLAVEGTSTAKKDENIVRVLKAKQ